MNNVLQFSWVLYLFIANPFAGSNAVYELPITGGNGPMVVTAIGIGLAVLSLLLFVLRGKSDDKKKGKPRK